MFPARDERFYRTFLYSVSLTVGLCLSAVFLGIAVSTKRLIHDQILSQARAHFQSILLTRKWNSSYGGVYVEKRPGVETTPYIEDAEVVAADGRVFTIRNPAFMTREISAYSTQAKLFSFHMSSLTPLNEHNRPDPFEREALERFEAGEQEFYAFLDEGTRAVFRYIAPLYVEEGCLPCHAKQGYSVGDVRGGISVKLEVGDLERKITQNFIRVVVLGTGTVALLLGTIYLFTFKLIKKLEKSRRIIERLATTDELTGLLNRRSVMRRFSAEFQRTERTEGGLGCILIDVDHFKEINDSQGHLYGDEVLARIGTLLQERARVYDVVGRYGGEEFLVVASDTTPHEILEVAERMRGAVKDAYSSAVAPVTISLGVAVREPGDTSVDQVLHRADERLYRAKRAGRDRVAET